MQEFLTRIEKIKTPQLYLALTILAALLASRVQYIQHGWINRDTVLYFESARLISIGQFKEAISVYNWLTYPACIAGIHNLTSLSIHHSAQLLSVVFFTITTASFAKIIELGGGNKKTILTGALILFSSSYIVGDVLEWLMRDQGFWACFLTSLVFFIRFNSRHRYGDAFLWQVFAILATLFRIEAIMYLLFLPLIFLFETNESLVSRVKNLIKSNFVNILAALLIILALSFNSKLSMQSFGRLQEVFTNKLLQELTYNLITKSQIMSEQVLQYLPEYAVSGLLLTFLFVIAVKSIVAPGIINFLLAAYGITQKKLIRVPVYRTLKATAIIALITMSLIIVKVFLLSGRYVVALAFVVMIVAAFQLGNMLTEYSKSKIKNKKWVFVTSLIFIFMLGSTIKNIWPKAQGYNYMQDAIAWIKQNKHDNTPVFYNEPRLRYYAGEKFIGTWMTQDDWKIVQEKIKNGEINQYNDLIISYSSKHLLKIDELKGQLTQFSLVKNFTNARGKKGVLIFKKIRH